MSSLAPPQLSSMLRDELKRLLDGGKCSARDISEAISPSALSRFIHGDEEAGLRINTFERILQKINGHIQIFFSSSGQAPVHFTPKLPSETDRFSIHRQVCMALIGGPAGIYGRNGLCYAVNDELRQLLGLTSADAFFDDHTPLHRELKAHQQFLQHSLRPTGDSGNAAAPIRNASSSREDNAARADSQTPMRIFQVAYGENSATSMFVGEVARLLECTPTDTIRREFGGELLVVSFSDATDIQLRLEELDTLWKLINDDSSQINMHVVEPSVNPSTKEMDDYSKVTFVSNSARSLLQIDRNAKDIRLKDFVCTNTDKLAERMRQKFENGKLSVNRSRTFHKFRQGGRVLPVAIDDYGVAEVRPNPPHSPNTSQNQRRFAKVFTLWRQTRIPEDIMRILEIYGARNPVLAQAQIQSMVKQPVPSSTEAKGVAEKGSEEVVPSRFDYKLVYMNPVFRSKHESRLRDLADKDGPLESEVFNKPKDQELQREYHRIDERVLRRAEETGAASMERVERHRYQDSRDESDNDGVDSDDDRVHVVKIAVQERIGPDDPNKQWVLHIFFWPANREQEEQVFAALRAYYSAWRILDSLPLPVYAKDSTLSLVYANKAYIEDVRAVAAESDRSGPHGVGIEKQSDLVGRSDGHFFPTEQAYKYESDDRRLLSGNSEEPYHCHEAHGNARVQVWKKVIRFSKHRDDSGSDEDRGIVGIYCQSDGGIAPAEAPIKRRRGRPPAMKLPRKNSLTSPPDNASLNPERGVGTPGEES